MKYQTITPVEVENRTTVVVTLQLVKTTIVDINGEHEIAPEILLSCNPLNGKGDNVEVIFTVNEIDKFISQLQRLKNNSKSVIFPPQQHQDYIKGKTT